MSKINQIYKKLETDGYTQTNIENIIANLKLLKNIPVDVNYRYW